MTAARPRVDKVVVLGPNTAIQGQWVDQGRGLSPRPGHGPLAGLDRDRADLPVGGRLRPRGGGTRRSRSRAENAPLTARLHENGAALVARLRDGRAAAARPGRVPPPARGVGPAARRAARAAAAGRRAGAHRHPARDADGRPGPARRRAVRRRRLRGLHPGRRPRGRPGAVRRAGLAHRADRRRVGLAGERGEPVQRAGRAADGPDLRLDAVPGLARRALPRARGSLERAGPPRAGAVRRRAADAPRRAARACPRAPYPPRSTAATPRPTTGCCSWATG